MFAAKKYVKNFNFICAQEGMDPNASTLRSILLYVSGGICDARFLMDVQTGKLVDKAKICKLSALVFEMGDKNVGFTTQGLQKSMRAKMAAEKKNRNAMDGVCAQKASVPEFLGRAMTTAKTLTEFRQQVAAELKDDFRAIHFLEWNGEPRQSMKDIAWATCYYHPQRSVTTSLRGKVTNLWNDVHRRQNLQTAALFLMSAYTMYAQATTWGAQVALGRQIAQLLAKS